MNWASSSLPILDLTAGKNGVQWQFPLPIMPLSAILPAAHQASMEKGISTHPSYHPRHLNYLHNRYCRIVPSKSTTGPNTRDDPPIRLSRPLAHPLIGDAIDTHSLALQKIWEVSGWRSVNYSRSQNPINYFETCRWKYVFIVKKTSEKSHQFKSYAERASFMS